MRMETDGRQYCKTEHDCDDIGKQCRIKPGDDKITMGGGHEERHHHTERVTATNRTDVNKVSSNWLLFVYIGTVFPLL
jgi:hypothetical protein